MEPNASVLSAGRFTVDAAAVYSSDVMLRRCNGNHNGTVGLVNDHVPRSTLTMHLRSQFIRSVEDPGTQCLKWYQEPQSVLVVKKRDLSIIPAFTTLCNWLAKDRGLQVFVEDQVVAECQATNNLAMNLPAVSTFSYASADLSNKIDLIVCLGGDGTLLYASSLFQESVPPVLAFHLGSLGFLMSHSFSDFRSTLDKTLAGKATLTLRSRLHCTLSTARALSSPGVISNNQTFTIKHQIRRRFSDTRQAEEIVQVLNEVVVDRGPSPFICNLDVYIGHRCVTTMQGDGLIVCTPTGSTAYAMAAGANMIHPSVPALMLAPICPHSLSFRPIVLPAGIEIVVRPSPQARSTAWVSFDGRDRQEMLPDSCLRITTSPFPVPCVAKTDPTDDWFGCLADCLHWNFRRLQLPLVQELGPSNEDVLEKSSQDANAV